MAHTTFKLTWTRKYERRGNACVLAVARPKLIITYTLPKPVGRAFRGPLRQAGPPFIAGIETHERVHGDYIKEMVRDIEAMSVGLSADDDPDCRKIRIELTKRLGELSARQRQQRPRFRQGRDERGRQYPPPHPAARERPLRSCSNACRISPKRRRRPGPGAARPQAPRDRSCCSAT